MLRIYRGPGLNVRRFDPETGELEATDWPPHLSHLRERIERTRENLPQLPERGWSPFDGKAPSLLVPLVGGDGRSRRGANPIFHLLVVVLDADFLRGVFFPDLVSRHFGGSTQNEFRIWIRDAESQQKKFEWPQESDELIPARVDVRQPLFLLRNPREFGSGQRGRGAGFGRGRRVRPPGPPRGPVAGRGAGAGGWELLAVHRLGSLEVAVNRAKYRNLSVTIAILLVLGISILVTLLSAQRSRDLARRQMDFVASVSHELRTPLTAIRSAANNLKDGVVSEKSQVTDYGRLIGKAEARLNEMVMKVLDFARSQSTGPAEALDAIEVRPLIEKVVDDLLPSALKSSVQTVLQVPPDLPRVLAGPSGLQRVLENLIQNAVKYSEGNAKIEIAACKRGSQVEISVRDDGPGIGTRDLRQIFEPFFRGSNVQETQIQGSGLGLSLVKRIVESFGGKVDVESQVGKGTVFRILLKTPKGV